MPNRKKKPSKAILENPYPRPALHLPVGDDRGGRLRLSDAIAIEVPGAVANTLIVLQEAWRRGRGLIDADRGWLNAILLNDMFISVLGKTVVVSTTQAYITRTFKHLKKEYEALGLGHLLLVEKLTGRGIHLIRPIDVRESDGGFRLAEIAD